MNERLYITQAFNKRFKGVKKVQNYTLYIKNNFGLKLINPCTVKSLIFVIQSP